MAHTLADYKARPQTQKLDFSSVSVPDIIAQYANYKNVLIHPLVAPEIPALDFYLMNAAVAALMLKTDDNQPLTPQEEFIVQTYYEEMEKIGLRAFYYLLLICTRETRHGKMTPSQAELMVKLGTNEFWHFIHKTGEDEVIQKLCSNPPKVSLRDYTTHLLGCFELGSWGGSYGGPKWANVTKPLRDFVHGTSTTEMLLDVVWALAHNGGPIFNKGMLFKTYNAEELIKILDVQRAGMIPNLVWHNGTKFVQPYQRDRVEAIRAVIPDFGVAPIDWTKVKTLGAVGDYDEVQVNPAVIAKEHIAKPQFFKPKVKIDPAVFQVTITPGDFVTLISRKDLKAAKDFDELMKEG